MGSQFSNRVHDVLRYSQEEALKLGNDYIGTEHILLGMIREGEGIAVKILKNLGVDLQKLSEHIEDKFKGHSIGSPTKTLPLSKQVERILRLSEIEARAYKNDIVGTEHILLAMLRDKESQASKNT